MCDKEFEWRWVGDSLPEAYESVLLDCRVVACWDYDRSCWDDGNYLDDVERYLGVEVKYWSYIPEVDSD